MRNSKTQFVPEREPGVPLTDLELGETGIIELMALPADVQELLMHFGFAPNARIKFSRRAPLGDPNVYCIDGAEIALRAETARHILVLRSNHLQISERP